MDEMLLHDGGFALLHDEPVFPERFMGASVKFPREEPFARADRVGAVNDDDVVKILHALREGDAVANMDMQLRRRIEEDFRDLREIFFGEVDDAPVNIAEVHLSDAFVAAHFSRHAAVAAADDEDALRMGMEHERHVADHFMIGPFVLFRRLEYAVQHEHAAVLEGFGDLDMLVRRRFFVEHLRDLHRLAQIGRAPFGDRHFFAHSFVSSFSSAGTSSAGSSPVSSGASCASSSVASGAVSSSAGASCGAGAGAASSTTAGA